MADLTDLTPVHISTEDTPRRVPAGVKWHDWGTLAVVKRETEIRTCASCGKDFEEMLSSRFVLCMGCRPITAVCDHCGAMTTVTRRTRSEAVCPDCGNSLATVGKRGVISTFSAAARRRLMRRVAQTDERIRPAFLTLTFPDQLEYADPRQAKVILKRFEVRFRRTFGRRASYFWRIETVKRKSGKYVGMPFPHFHLLVYGVTSPRLFRFVLENWRYCVGSDILPVFHVRTIRSAAGVRAYCAKVISKSGNMPGEIGKTAQTDAGHVGRWYGQVLKDNFQRFVSAVVGLDLTDRESIQVLRAFRKFARVKARQYRSLTVFMRGQWLKDAVPKLAVVLSPPWHFRATGRDIEVPFWKWAYDAGLLVPVLETAP